MIGFPLREVGMLTQTSHIFLLEVVYGRSLYLIHPPVNLTLSNQLLIQLGK